MLSEPTINYSEKCPVEVAAWHCPSYTSTYCVCLFVLFLTVLLVLKLLQTFNEVQKLLSKTNGKVIADVMTPAPLVVRETTNLEDAARLSHLLLNLFPNYLPTHFSTSITKHPCVLHCQIAIGNKIPSSPCGEC